jgi:hypothetical protein
MVTQFNDKGKIFTDVIPKHPVKVWIQTVNSQIRGQIHVKHDTRIKDELDGTLKFLALTSASIFSEDGMKLTTKCGFMTVNIDQIVWIIPEDDLQSDG